MKKILENKIINIKNTPTFDNKFLFSYLIPDYKSNDDIEVFFMWELLKQKENKELLSKIWDRYAMYSNVYSEKYEIEIFKNLFNYAINNNKKIHIIWITLKEELDIIEYYYTSLWFLREDINCFMVDFAIPLITVSVNIENLIWKWSDYKKMKKEIFFIPPIREAWFTKAMFKWINRWVIASINIKSLNNEIVNFLQNSILEEHIFPINLWKILYFNLKSIWFSWEEKDIIIDYWNNYWIVNEKEKKIFFDIQNKYDSITILIWLILFYEITKIKVFVCFITYFMT